MERAKTERYIVVILFVLVLVVFSFAERDSKKLEKLYTNVSDAGQLQHMTKAAETLSAVRY